MPKSRKKLDYIFIFYMYLCCHYLRMVSSYVHICKICSCVLLFNKVFQIKSSFLVIIYIIVYIFLLSVLFMICVKQLPCFYVILQVLVVGNPANTNAYICKMYAKDIPSQNFTCMTRLDQNRAQAQVRYRSIESESCSVSGNVSKICAM